MTDILTLTMNPALDVLTSIDKVSDTHKMRCGHTLKHPGGGGVNVARVLHRLGANCVALYLAGGVTGERHHKLMSAEKVRCHVIPIAEETRESFSVHETSSGHDFRFVLPGPNVSVAEYEACFDYVSQRMPKKFLVISGGLAPGVPVDFYARLTALAKQHGVRVVLDANGPALAEALREGVYLFKPSLRELRDLTGQALSDEDSQVAASRLIITNGQAEIVALSLGSEGALLITATQAWRALSLSVNVKTTIGAGDSFLAAMTYSLTHSASLELAMKHGMAAGSAALLNLGTSLCQPNDLYQLLNSVLTTSLKLNKTT